MAKIVLTTYRRRRRRSARTLLVAAFGCAGLGLAGLSLLHRPRPFIIYNASASAQIGYYWVEAPYPVGRGDLVLARTPDSVRELAAQRDYLPVTVPLVKRVEGVAGDVVCARDHVVTINGRRVAYQFSTDRLGRPLPRWSGCLRLRYDEIFLLMEGVPDSFDGRYFGPVPVRSVIGKLVPLWLR